MGILDDQKIDLPCPGCGHQTPKEVGWLKEEPESYVCAGCGETVALDFEDEGGLKDALQGVDDAIDRLRDSFRDLGK